MAVPNTTTFSLQDVVDEINPTTDDLVDCVSDAILGSYDSTYFTAPATSLLEFRNYGAVVVPTINATSKSFSEPAGYSIDIDLVVNSGVDVAFIIIAVNVSLGTVTVTDTKSATWTSVYSTSNIAVYSCTDLVDTGTRTITAAYTSSFFGCAIAATVDNASTTLVHLGSSSDLATSALTINNTVTPANTGTLQIGIAYTHRSGSNTLTWTSYGSGQTVVDNYSIAGVTSMALVATSENTGATTSNTQSFTNSDTGGDKYSVVIALNPA
jgi:hypothetical protein